MFQLRSVVGVIIVANVIVFGIQMMFPLPMHVHFALWPWGEYDYGGSVVGFKPWQLVTSAFMHDTKNYAHIAFNMFALYQFGGDVERVMGARLFAWLYGASILTGSLVQLIVVSMSAEPSATLGASGGVFGVLLAFGMLFPRRRVLLLIPPIPMPAWVLVAGYGAVELVQGVLGTQQGVAHFAHLGGMLGAFIVLFTMGRETLRRARQIY